MGRGGKRRYFMLTVDWEKDHSIYRYVGESKPDYGGILVGTSYLEKLLDELQISCTWLVETHKDYPYLDIPKLFPEKVLELKARKRDEVGSHIHWGKWNQAEQKWTYHPEDTQWVSAQIKHAKNELRSLGIDAKSFRSGGFAYVPKLPLILQAQGYSVDSSNSTKLSRWQAYFWILADPYRCDLVNLRKPGQSNIIEFPVFFHPVSLLQGDLKHTLARRLFWGREAIHLSPTFTTIYMHIDELTNPKTGPDDKTQIDPATGERLKAFLRRLVSNKDIAFITLSRARELYKEAHSGSGHEQIMSEKR